RRHCQICCVMGDPNVGFFHRLMNVIDHSAFCSNDVKTTHSALDAAARPEVNKKPRFEMINNVLRRCPCRYLAPAAMKKERAEASRDAAEKIFSKWRLLNLCGTKHRLQRFPFRIRRHNNNDAHECSVSMRDGQAFLEFPQSSRKRIPR